MSKVKEELKADVVKRFGPGADAVIDYLFNNGTLTDAMARNHMAKLCTYDMMMLNKENLHSIMHVVGFRYGITPTYVYVLTNAKNA